MEASLKEDEEDKNYEAPCQSSKSGSLPEFHPYYRKGGEFREVHLEERPDSADEIWDLSNIPRLQMRLLRRRKTYFPRLRGNGLI
ncbi:Uncharacterized protein FKW44_021279 [Caligus rogercresseyi]|uniref:Uncharacterized protein n=1 Tax=Caligus rogercresseyi TaxID=217165 RepID=A0A7T8GQZ6_CALRO|nr:Uncharacterized protein FKW44_021279 [Caligus rogercresseyi]